MSDCTGDYLELMCSFIFIEITCEWVFNDYTETSTHIIRFHS